MTLRDYLFSIAVKEIRSKRLSTYDECVQEMTADIDCGFIADCMAVSPSKAQTMVESTLKSRGIKMLPSMTVIHGSVFIWGDKDSSVPLSDPDLFDKLEKLCRST